MQNPNIGNLIENRAENQFADWRRGKRLASFIAIATLFIVLGLWLYWGMIISLACGFVLYYLLSPLVIYLENLGLKRYYAIPVIALILAILLGIGFWFLLPALYDQISQLAALAPQAINNFVENNLPVIQEKISQIPFLSEFNIYDYIKQQVEGDAVAKQYMTAISGIWSSTPVIISSLLYIILIPVVTLALLLEERYIVSGFWKLIPRDLVLPLRVFITQLNRNFLILGRGLLTVATILGILYMVGFSLVDLKFALLIGAIAGACRVIPYLDVLVGAILSAVAIFADFQGWGQVIMVLGVFAFVFTIDGLLITPKVIGESIGLHPVFLIISIFAFGYWWGIVGVLLAIPVMTFIKVVLKSLLPFYYISPWYRPDFREFRDTNS